MRADASYDVVVVGSGFGGAVTALRLSQGGRRVLVLEQGRRWDKNDFPRTVGQSGRAFWQPGTSQGFLEYRAFRNMDVIQGVGVGGGSLHYFNVNTRAPARVLNRWPRPLSRDCLEPYYDRALQVLGSKPFEAPVGRATPARTQTFCKAVADSGLGKARLLDIAVHTGPETSNALGVKQEPCNYCGNCMLGCQVHAKSTLDINYLGLAERMHGAVVWPLCKASLIRPADDEGEGYHVDFVRLDAGLAEADRRGSVYGRQVVVAAGALGSTELLLRSAREHRTLPKISGALGRGFSGNGDMLFAGAINTPLPVDPANGPSITAIVDCSTEAHAISIEDLGLPDPMLWFAEASLPPGRRRLLGYLRLLGRYVASSLGLAPRESRVSDEIGRLLRGGRTVHFLPFLGMGSDAADGRLFLCDGELDLDWDHKASRPMFDAMEKAMRQIALATGGEWSRSFLWRWPVRKLLTAHPLGGCTIGDDADTSVVNHTCEVWGYPGLFVVDGAAIPSALAVNPSLTIAAVAERAAFWMLHGRDLLATERAAHSG
jgi:cholesterol oxidase